MDDPEVVDSFATKLKNLEAPLQHWWALALSLYCMKLYWYEALGCQTRTALLTSTSARLGPSCVRRVLPSMG